MSTTIQLHILHNTAAANLNRDDLGAPKDIIFGGVRRIRYSSQAKKRAARTNMRNSPALKNADFTNRSRAILPQILEALEALGNPADENDELGRAIYAALKLDFTKGSDTTSANIMSWSPLEIHAVAQFAIEHKHVLLEQPGKGKKKTKGIPPKVLNTLLNDLATYPSIDTALWGRMMAALPHMRVDGASQVAHAIGVTSADKQFDYFTAVDDLHDEGDAGAAHVQTNEFYSTTFYHYSNLDVDQLQKNLAPILQDTPAILETAIREYLRFMITSLPTGKQNTFAAHQPADFLMISIRKNGQPISLANAFIKPITPTRDQDLMELATRQFLDFTEGTYGMYGAPERTLIVANKNLHNTTKNAKIKNLEQHATVEEFINQATNVALEFLTNEE